MHRQIVRAIRRRLDDERGVALLMALGILLVLSLGFATSIALTSSGSRHAQRSKADQKAYALAEEGINNAVAVIFADANEPPLNSDCNDPSWNIYKSLLTPARTTTRPEGSVTWSGVFNCVLPIVNSYWTVTSVATVANPTGPGTGALRRTVTARVPFEQGLRPTTTTRVDSVIVPSTVTRTETTYTDSVGSQTVTNTSTTYDDPGFTSGSIFYTWGDLDACGGTGGMIISTSIYTEGNFCLAGGSSQVWPSAALVNVKGTISSTTWIGMGPSTPPTLLKAMNATDNKAIVTSFSGFEETRGGMIVIDGEYMTYSGTSVNTGSGNNGCDFALAAGQGCFIGLTRGFLPDRPATAHAVNATVDGRIADVRSKGGCVDAATCTWIHAVTRDIGPGATLYDPFKPTVDPVAVRAGAAPGPNHLPSPACTIGGIANPFATGADIYFKNNLGTLHSGSGEYRLDLTPSSVGRADSSYTCTATGGAYGPGQLSWNDTTKELKVYGVVYIPTNVTISQNLYYTTFDAGSPRQSGQLYVAGTVNYNSNICAKRNGTDCDTRTWDPNFDSELAIVSPNLPASGGRPAQSGIATNPSHTIEGINAAQLQGFIYTDGVFTRSGGNGFVSGSVFAGKIIFQGGAATAPAPGSFRLPSTIGGLPRVTTTYTTTPITTSVPSGTTEYTDTTDETVYITTTVPTTVTAPVATTPQDFGG